MQIYRFFALFGVFYYFFSQVWVVEHCVRWEGTNSIVGHC